MLTLCCYCIGEKGQCEWGVMVCVLLPNWLGNVMSCVPFSVQAELNIDLAGEFGPYNSICCSMLGSLARLAELM